MFYNSYFISWYNWYYGIESIPNDPVDSEPPAEGDIQSNSRPNSPVPTPSISQLETEQETVTRAKRSKVSTHRW